ncbi:MAG: 16S rRNA (uracil(1498)-N(3))-methyltransferase [Clostridia bacterium]|nr:16S rRNA (uracil(1498)-N(3))-methyltransferase [Clostridia bacterium]
MARFFADSFTDTDAVIIEDAAHIVRTLRLGMGHSLTVMDGAGRVAEGVINAVSASAVSVSHSGWKKADTESELTVTVYQGICKNDRFSVVVQKCTELGAVRIVPLHTRRCEIPKADMDKRRDRMRKIAREAAKQCGRALVPEIGNSIEVGALAPEHDLLLCPYEGETQGGFISSLMCFPAARNIGLVIGPEGGFEADEIAVLQQLRAEIVTLGPRILRTETAGPAALAALMAHYGQWEGRP